MKKLNDEATWLEIEKHLKNQIKNKEVIEAMNFFLELGLGEVNLAYSIELSLIDKYEGMVATWLAINEAALIEERYEINNLIDKAFLKQNNIILRVLAECNASDEEIWSLEYTREFFHITKQQQANITTSK
jgi:hypothetical protein